MKKLLITFILVLMTIGCATPKWHIEQEKKKFNESLYSKSMNYSGTPTRNRSDYIKDNIYTIDYTSEYVKDKDIDEHFNKKLNEESMMIKQLRRFEINRIDVFIDGKFYKSYIIPG